MASANLQGSCTFCGNKSNLEIWLETQQLLCKRCMVEQFENWRKLKVRECYEIEGSLEVYKKRIGSVFKRVFMNKNFLKKFSVIRWLFLLKEHFNLNQNLEAIKSAQEHIESVYNSYISLLNQEKSDLLATLDQLKKEKYFFSVWFCIYFSFYILI